jgi:hypothetical protein
MEKNLVIQILNKNKKEKIDKIEVINQKISQSINMVYRPYQLFPKNKDNRGETETTLINNYQLVEGNNLIIGDYIRYLPKFNVDYIGHNIKLKTGGFCTDINYQHIFFKSNGNIFKANKKKYFFYRKLTENDLFKINLLEKFS